VKPDIKAQTQAELQAQFRSWGEPLYRAAQLLRWLYVQRVQTWDAMTNLPAELRERLAKTYTLNTLALVARQQAEDGTQKFLWRLPDGALVESVLLGASPALYGEPSDRHTLCVSTQVGCAYGCRFCASGLGGWKRNLAVEELVEQVLAAERWHAAGQAGGRVSQESGGAEERRSRGAEEQGHVSRLVSPVSHIRSQEAGLRSQESGVKSSPSRAACPSAPLPLCPSARVIRHLSRIIDNLVIMGMGEPLANYDNLLEALRILNAAWGGGIGARKITISTCGLAPQIRQLADEPMQVRLTVSLHGATDQVRSRLMPVNRKHSLAQLVAACEYYLARKGRMLTLEYVLIAGVNVGPEHALRLAGLARRLKAKVNLIPYNPVEGLPWERPDEAAQEAFLRALVSRGVTATLRREKGREIHAACGQLRLKTERMAG